jgi:hypothetical protein
MPLNARGAQYVDFPTAAQGEKTGEEKMWGTFVDQISEDDKWMIDAWIEDANGILAFVSLDLLVPLFIILTRGFKDGSSLRNDWCLYYRVLQKVVARFRWPNSRPSWTNFTATLKFPKWHIHCGGKSTVLSQCIHDLGQRDVAYKPRV